jgi:hypothetical protein
MPDTVDQIILDVQAVCPGVDPNLARSWVRTAARRTMEARQWSWLMRKVQIKLYAPVTSAASGVTCSVEEGSEEVVFSAPVLTERMTGRQFRTSQRGTIHDLIVISPTLARIEPPYVGETDAASHWMILHNRVVIDPSIKELLSVYSPSDRWRLHVGVQQELIDNIDPSRTRSGSPCVFSPLDFTSQRNGSVSEAVQVTGNGDVPVSSGVYVGQNDGVLIVTVTTGGVGGVAQFTYRKGNGAAVGPLLTDPAGNVTPDGVTLAWPATSTFNLNDVFVISLSAGTSTAAPRFEVYPYPTADIILTALAITHYPDVTDDNVQLPGLLINRGDILTEKALEFAASWPGTEDQPNPYNQINRRDYHSSEWLKLVGDLARQDNSLFQRNVTPVLQIPWAPWSHGGDPQTYDPWYLYQNI